MACREGVVPSSLPWAMSPTRKGVAGSAHSPAATGAGADDGPEEALFVAAAAGQQEASTVCGASGEQTSDRVMPEQQLSGAGSGVLQTTAGSPPSDLASTTLLLPSFMPSSTR